MLKIAGIFFILISSLINIFSQNNVNGSDSNPVPEFVRRNAENQQKQNETSRKADENLFGKELDVKHQKPITIIEEPILTNKDLAKIQPDKLDYALYSKFLSSKKNKLVKILIR